MNYNYQFCLASSSPRRREILEREGYFFSIINPSINEDRLSNEDPFEYVKRMALFKSLEGYNIGTKSLSYLGADTIIVFKNNSLGKPKDLDDAVRILSSLSGNEHYVATAITLTSNGSVMSDIAISKVKFKVLTQEDILNYCQTGEPFDKAGAYGIQGLGRNLVEYFTGSFSNIVGLPIEETNKLLAFNKIYPIKL